MAYCIVTAMKAPLPSPSTTTARGSRQQRDAIEAESIPTALDGKHIAPTFAFIDPFGFSGVPMEAVRRLGANPKCEVLISFMYESITRWAAHPDPKIKAHLDDLFGTAAWRASAAETNSDRRRDRLVELYRRQLMAADFPYVLEFELRDKGNRTEYFLCFGTKSLKGLAAMKRAMWNADPEGGKAFSDYIAFNLNPASSDANIICRSAVLAR